MSDENSADVDPRFDPAFQRGFDPNTPIAQFVPTPQVERVEPPGSLVTPSVVSAPRASPAPVPVPVPVPVPATEGAPVDELPSVVTVDEPGIETVVDGGGARNPFLLVLGLVAIALIGAGFWLFTSAGDSFNSSVVRSTGDYMSLVATIDAAPFVALLGAATAIGVLFVFAARYRRRR